MTSRMQGKTALVTAAGQGIGRASALAMAAAGANVYASDLNLQTVEDAASEARDLGGSGAVTAVQLDVTQDAQVGDLAKHLGAIDVLFNCAGFVHHGSILDSDETDWDAAFNLNVKAMWRTVRAFLPAMLDNGGGSIINMSSLASSVKGVPERCVYGASKAAVIGLTKSIAADYVARGIRCNAICPGTVQSPSLEQRLRATGDYDKARAQFIGRQPMQRLGSAEEIAALVVYLGSDESGYTTGQAHVIDGGWAT